MLTKGSQLLLILSACVTIPACATHDGDIEDGEHDSASGKSDSIAEGSAQARAILAVVNDLDIGVRELDIDASLSNRAARNIIEHRDGADVEPGTSDDDTFDTLAELDAIPYVGPATLQALLDYAASLGLLDEDAHLTARWSFKSFASNQTASCPTGFDTIAVHAQALDEHRQPVGAPIIDLFDCADGTGTTAPLPPAAYQVWIASTTNDGATEYAASPSQLVDLRDSDKTVSAAILTDGGYFSLAWELRGAQTNQPLECSQVVGLDGVETIATSIANPTGAISDKFDCADKRGVTGGLLAGTYTVSVDAFEDAGGALGVAPALVNKVVRAPNKVTDLGTVIIPIDGR